MENMNNEVAKSLLERIKERPSEQEEEKKVDLVSLAKELAKRRSKNR